LAEQDSDVDWPGKVDHEDRAMRLEAMGNGFRVLIEVITSMVAPGRAANRAASSAFVSQQYRQCDPRASGYCCLRIVYPEELETGIIKFPGYAVSRQPFGMGSEHGAA
jgi:hypothetical protein